jgi:hypothetical protein
MIDGTYDVNILYMPDSRKMQADTESEAAIDPSIAEAFEGRSGGSTSMGCPSALWQFLPDPD